MPKLTEHVELLVENQAGVLVRVVSHIRREGWNIKSLTVDETDNSQISKMVMEIEGTHTKLAQVVQRMLNIDCVIEVLSEKDGEVVVTRRPEPTQIIEEKVARKKVTVADKKEGAIRILTINPGSTSTKFAVYDDETPVFEKTIRHDPKELRACGTIIGQKELRTSAIVGQLERAGVAPETLDAIAGRGGLLKPIDSGTYTINEAMITDLGDAAAALHASALGAIIAREIADGIGVEAYVVDPIVVDEMDPFAKLSGMPGVERSSVFHALNQKAIARRAAADMGKAYEACRLVVAHLGGGITVGAHRYGRVVDVNDALSGEGPFSPERPGQIPLLPLVRMCFSGEYTQQEMIDKVTKGSGMEAYLGTNDLKKVEKMIRTGDEFAALVVDSMAYQVCKEIGAMAAVLEGRVDAIVLTGGLAHSTRFTGSIRGRVETLAPVMVYPGEDEMLALMSGALRVMRGEQTPSVYQP